MELLLGEDCFMPMFHLQQYKKKHILDSLLLL